MGRPETNRANTSSSYNFFLLSQNRKNQTNMINIGGTILAVQFTFPMLKESCKTMEDLIQFCAVLSWLVLWKQPGRVEEQRCLPSHQASLHPDGFSLGLLIFYSILKGNSGQPSHCRQFYCTIVWVQRVRLYTEVLQLQLTRHPYFVPLCVILFSYLYYHISVRF